MNMSDVLQAVSNIEQINTLQLYCQSNCGVAGGSKNKQRKE